MPTSLIILLVVVIALAVGVQILLPILKRSLADQAETSDTQAPPVDRYERKRFVLTQAEYSYYKVLHQILPPDRIVLVKVRLADLFDVRSGLSPSERQKAINRITSKHLDFIICDRATCVPQLAIELDDGTHQRADRKTRDSFVDGVCHATGFTLVRQPVKRGYVLEEVRVSLGFDRQPEPEAA